MSTSSLCCTVCVKSFSGIESFHQHMASVRHKKKIEEETVLKEEGFSGNMFYCDICNTSVSGPLNWKAHLAGAQHEKKTRRRQLGIEDGMRYIKIEENQQMKCALDKNGSDDYNFCLLCNVHFTSLVNAVDHYRSDNHERKVAEQKVFTRNFADSEVADSKVADEIKVEQEENETQRMPNEDVPIPDAYRFCSVCKVFFSGPESAIAHYKGIKHGKNVARQSLFNSGSTVSQNFVAEVLQKKGCASLAQDGVMDNYSCSVCDVKFSGPENAKQHYEGSKHAKNLKKKETTRDFASDVSNYFKSNGEAVTNPPALAGKQESNIEKLESLLTTDDNIICLEPEDAIPEKNQS